MKKIALLVALLIAGCSNSPKTLHVAYNGNAVNEKLHLAKGDVVMIDTTVPIGTRVLIEVYPNNNVDANNLTFTSSMENASPNRQGKFVDQMFTGANPGWVSYTFTGDKAADVVFNLHP